MHIVELVKPSTEPSAQVKGDRFDRGERIIMVDGKRWGRTCVKHHGMHGTTHTFIQDEGEALIEDPKARYPREISVHSMNKRRSFYRGGENEYRPTEDLVLEKAQELVASGRLRDPAIVKAEHERAMEAYRLRCAEAENERKANFRDRACVALGINQDDGSEIINRIVAAMEWAQTQ